MTSVAVVAHRAKKLGGTKLGHGLDDLRTCLSDHGVADPQWFEIAKSKKAPSAVRAALDVGADLVFVWGGDGTVQRSIDTVAALDQHERPTLAILPAGTANLLATNLGIPKDLDEAVRAGLHGDVRTLDVGVMNGEHFAVMGGIGLDALMIKDADSAKAKIGRAAYVVAGARRIRIDPVATTVKLDGEKWFDGKATCVLVGNVGQLMGGLTAFPDASPEDGRLDVAVITADGAWQWATALTRTVTGHPEKSKHVEMRQAERISIRTKTPMRYEMDGGARSKTDHLKVSVVPAAVSVRVPSGR